MNKLSVIVPVYNAEKTLVKCVDSILSQEYSNIEVVLVDDGSRDSSLDICNEYAKKDSRVVVYHKENAGLVAARKSGVKIATGEYIGFVDSDDYVDTNMYSTLMSQTNEKQVDIAIGGIKHAYSDGNITTTFNGIPEGFYDKSAVKEIVIPKMMMEKGFYKYGIIPGVVVKVFKKELIEKSLESVGNDITLGEDVAITSYAVALAESVSIVEAAGYYYVQTETSMIRGYNPKRFDALCRMYSCIDRIQNSDYKKQIGSYFACVLYGIFAECVRHNKPEEAKIQISDMLDNPITKRALAEAIAPNWRFFDKVKLFLMKHKMRRILIAVLSR